MNQNNQLRSNNSTTTIAAQATAPGRGGVGVVRVSGPLVPEIAAKILGTIPKNRYATVSSFYAANNSIIDQGLAIYFENPHSFTGEDVLELQGHGGQVVLDLVLQRVFELGACAAKPGEFLERAYCNHKIDLAQAEAVADLINAATSQAAQNAARTMSGLFSDRVNTIVALLIELRTHIEATLDFPNEDENVVTSIALLNNGLGNLLKQIDELLDIAKQGIILRDGIAAVITGKPNAGKSSLLNKLSGQEIAIVTDVPGTTRDVLHGCLQIDGMPVHLLDTAGLNLTPDTIESEGIRRAWVEIKRADHVILVVDASSDSARDPSKLWSEFFKELPEHASFTVIYNKIDLTGELPQNTKINNINCIYVSVKTGAGIDMVRQHLKESSGYHTVECGFSARRRHVAALERAADLLRKAQKSMLSTTLELVAADLTQAQHALGEITGEFTADDLLGKIFSEFCIGK